MLFIQRKPIEVDKSGILVVHVYASFVLCSLGVPKSPFGRHSGAVVLLWLVSSTWNRMVWLSCWFWWMMEVRFGWGRCFKNWSEGRWRRRISLDVCWSSSFQITSVCVLGNVKTYMGVCDFLFSRALNINRARSNRRRGSTQPSL